MKSKISLAELDALDAIAARIVADAFLRGDPDYNTNYADGGACPGLPWIAVRKTPGEVGQTSLIQASCPMGQALQIKMPFGGAKVPANHALRPHLERTVHGALVHELVHVHQCTQDAAAYAATVARQLTMESTDSDRPPADWLCDYYGEALEVEAHATQLAAELRRLGIALASDPQPDASIGATEVGRRIRSRLFPPDQIATREVEDWWASFVTAVFAIQEAWVTEARRNAVPACPQRDESS